MNRLIIIGNGFDLAHELRTSYHDFIKDYLYKAINKLYSQFEYSDSLIEMESKSYINTGNPDFKFATAESCFEDFEKIKKNSQYKVKIKSQLLSNTLENIQSINWVDIELEYFNLLCKDFSPVDLDIAKVKKLNRELEYLKFKIEEYLLEVVNSCDFSIIKEYLFLFNQFIEPREIITSEIKTHQPKNILFLNFNYTNLLEKYLSGFDRNIQAQIINIHGSLKDKSNSIIFGFGDEYNSIYQQFENVNNNELLKNIKSFGYFKTPNYHDLIRFINMDEFQVYVMGHSLGLSDRTMLKEVFESATCKSIKLFYYQINELENDFVEKTYEISRHFSDKGNMRKKIVPYTYSTKMPQISDSSENL